MLYRPKTIIFSPLLRNSSNRYIQIDLLCLMKGFKNQANIEHFKGKKEKRTQQQQLFRYVNFLMKE